MSELYELVKEAKKNKMALQIVINLFEPKIKRSLHLTEWKEQEDLAQELKCKLVSCIQTYDIDSIPGFWELRDQIDKRNQNLV